MPVRRQAAMTLRVPRTLSETQVDALLAAPDTTHALGVRDRCMLELMYASGLRVSELVTLKTYRLGLSEGVLRVTQTLMSRIAPVVTEDLPAAPYVENIGVRPDIELDYMTEENLLQQGRPFVSQVVEIISRAIRENR